MNLTNEEKVEVNNLLDEIDKLVGEGKQVEAQKKIDELRVKFQPLPGGGNTGGIKK